MTSYYDSDVIIERELENFYREHLEERIIFCLSERRNIPSEKAMELYYQSKLADRIHEGEYGVQYLDYSVLTDILEQELNDTGV